MKSSINVIIISKKIILKETPHTFLQAHLDISDQQNILHHLML